MNEEVFTMNEEVFGEFRKVRKWLERHRIEHRTEYLDYFGGYRLLAFTPAGEVSVICHEGSYGFPYGLLEYWCQKETAEPKGWQTAEDVISCFRRILKGEQK